MLDVKIISKTDEDYVVEFTYPDGKRLRILVPLKTNVWPLADTIDDVTYGLNFITVGHYF